MEAIKMTSTDPLEVKKDFQGATAAICAVTPKWVTIGFNGAGTLNPAGEFRRSSLLRS